MKKRCLSLLLAAAMLCAMLPVQAFAADPDVVPETAGSLETVEAPAETPASPETAGDAEPTDDVQPAPETTLETADETQTDPEATPETADEVQAVPETTPETADEAQTGPQTTPETADETQTDPETAPEQTPETAPDAQVSVLSLGGVRLLSVESPKPLGTIYYRGRGSGMTDKDGYVLDKLTHTVYFIPTDQSIAKSPENYSFAISGPGADGGKTQIEDADVHVGGRSSNYIYFQYKPQKEGTYTVTVTPKSGDEEPGWEGTLTLLALKLHAGEGKTFAADGDYAGGESYTTYISTRDTYLVNPDPYCPAISGIPAGQEFLGWCASQDDAANQKYTQTIARFEQENGTWQAWATYGEKPDYTFALYQGADESGTAIGWDGIATLQTYHHSETETPPANTFTIKNTGNRSNTIQWSSNNQIWWLERTDFGQGGTTLAKGDTIQFTLTPKAGLDAGAYQTTMMLVGNGGFRIYFTVKLTVSNGKLRAVLSKDLTKEYGATWSFAENTGNIQDAFQLQYMDGGALANGKTLQSLGLSIACDGFKADAAVGNYAYHVVGTPNDRNYNSIDEHVEGSLTVVPAQLSATVNATVTASTPASPRTLNDAAVTYAFTNPNNNQNVYGTFAWKHGDTPAVAEQGKDYMTAEYTFTPDDENHKPFEGEVQVKVITKTPTRLEPDHDHPGEAHTVGYDGKPHGLDFIADPQGDVTVQYAQILSTEAGGAENLGAWSTDKPIRVGTYRVKAEIAEREDYAAASYTTTLTITPKVAELKAYQPNAKKYDGTTTAANITAYVNNRATVNGKQDDVFPIVERAEYATKDAGYHAITVTISGLGGADAGNYMLPANPTATIAGVILAIPVTVEPKNEPDRTTKYYGQKLVYSESDFNIRGLMEGEPLNAEFTSPGEPAAAEVKNYDITVTIGNNNYTLGSASHSSVTSKVVGQLKVLPAPIRLRDEAVSVGAGKQGASLSTVAVPQGQFVNQYNPDLAVPGTFTWVDGSDTLEPDPDDPGFHTAQWRFTPSQVADPETNYDPRNYALETEYTGTVQIPLTTEMPVPVSAPAVTVGYNGMPHAVQVTPGTDNDRATFRDAVYSVQYKKRTETAAPAGITLQAANDWNTWTTEAPVDAGTYDVRVTVEGGTFGGTAYAANTVETTLTITRARPDTGSFPTEWPESVVEGTALADLVIDPDWILGYDENGELNNSLLDEGAFGWMIPDARVTADTLEFHWAFSPNSDNYLPTGGKVTFTLKDDTRRISAKIYNLPDSLGLPDYAVVDLDESGLKAGDAIMFLDTFPNASVRPVSARMEITPEAVEKGTLTVPLYSGALEPDESGQLFARIVTSSTHQATQVDYAPEPKLALTDEKGTPLTGDSLVLYDTGSSAVLAKIINLDEIVKNVDCSIADVRVTFMDGTNIVVLKQLTVDDLATLLRASDSVNTVMTVTVTLTFPDLDRDDGTFDLVKSILVAHKATNGKLSAGCEPDPNLPESGIQDAAVDPQSILDAVGPLTADDREVLKNNGSVNYSLTVEDAGDGGSDAAELTNCQNAPSDFTPLQYLDIDLAKIVTRSGAAQTSDDIHETDRPIRITLTIPDSMLEKAGGNMDLAVIRVHRDPTSNEVIDVTALFDQDPDPHILAFDTDLFSTYAIIAYPRSSTRPNPPADDGDDTTAQAPAAVQTVQPVVTIPQTADESTPALWRFAFLVSALGLCVTGFCLARRRRKNK